MTPEQKAAFVMSQSVAAMAEISGMNAENLGRVQQGLSIAYPEEAFSQISEKYQLGHNTVIAFFREG